MASSAISAKKLTKRFSPSRVPFRELSFEIPPGQFVAILGPSGCGKTTLLKLIAGLTPATEGELQKLTSRLAYVFQDAQLLPWRTVFANVALPLELRGMKPVEIRTAVLGALREVGLSEFADDYPAALSGGMKMRVSLARALVTDPEMILLDEPFAALDEVTRLRLDENLFSLWQRRRPTLLFVTHSISEAAFLSQRILLLSANGEGLAADIQSPLPPVRNMELRLSAEFGAFCKDLFARFESLERK